MIEFLKDILRNSPVVQGGLTLVVAGWLGYQARALPRRVWRIVLGMVTREIEIRERHPLYAEWLGLLTDGALRPGGPRTLEVQGVRNDFEEGEVDGASSAFAAGSSVFYARVCKKWCRVSVQREDSSGGRDLVARFIINVEVLFATRSDLSRMLSAAKARTSIAEPRQLVDLCSKHGGKTTISLPKRSPDTLCLPHGTFEGLEARVGQFLKSREWYERIGAPWRFGVLLHGSPGTGKTSVAHTLASQFGLRLAVVPLADLQADEELFDAFSAIGEGAITLLEDVDCAFAARQSNEAGGITFSSLLNCIDGVLAPQNGRVLVMSTNHPERLDPALIRPGRVDVRLEVPPLTREAASDYVDRVFPEIANRHAIVNDVMREAHPTAAILVNRLMRFQPDLLHAAAASRVEGLSSSSRSHRGSRRARQRLAR